MFRYVAAYMHFMTHLWTGRTTIILGCVQKCFLQKQGQMYMVQCVSEGHGKPPGGKTVETQEVQLPCTTETMHAYKNLIQKQ